MDPEKLDARFGKAEPPGGVGIKDFEVANGEVIRNPDLQVVRPGDKIGPLNSNMEYIWVVDEEGALRIGTEHRVGKDPVTGRDLKLGHPTLTGGRPARIGGELRLSGDGTPTINNFSGRYSRPYGRTVEQLRNAQQAFRDAGLPVEIQK